MSLAKLTLLTILAPLAACHNDGESKAKLPPKGEVAAASEPATKGGEAVAAPANEPNTKVGDAPAAAPAPAASPSAAPASEYRLTGQVAAIRHSQLGFKVAGTIATISAKPGLSFKEGAVLGQLDDRDFVLRAELAKVRRDTAKVQLDEAEKELKREQQLQKDNASTATVYDKVKSAADQARLGYRLAEIDLQNANNALKDTKLTAPYDCVVTEQMKFDGEGVQPVPPAPVLEISDTATPEISLSAPERLMGKLNLGDKLNVTVPSAGYSGKAEITRIVPVVSDKTRTFQVYAKLVNVDKKVIAGSYAEATMD